jgi:hypothetical protein
MRKLQVILTPNGQGPLRDLPREKMVKLMIELEHL